MEPLITSLPLIQCGNGKTAVKAGNHFSQKSGGGASSKTAEADNSAKAVKPGSHKDIPFHYAQNTEGAIKEYSKLLNLPKGEVKEILESVRSFTGNSSGAIRHAEMTGEKSKDVDNINKFLDKAPKYKGTIYRGLKFGSEAEQQEFIASLKAGKPSLRAMSSFSSSFAIAKEFSTDRWGDIVPGVIVRVQKNKSGSSLNQISGWDREKEVLVPKNTTFQVQKVRDLKNGLVMVSVSEVPR